MERWRYCVCDAAGIGHGIKEAPDVGCGTTAEAARQIAAGLHKNYEGSTLVLIGPHNVSLFRLDRGNLKPVRGR